MQSVFKSENQYATKRGDEIEVSPKFSKLFLESKTYSSNIWIITIFRKQIKISHLLKPSEKDTDDEKEETKT